MLTLTAISYCTFLVDCESSIACGNSFLFVVVRLMKFSANIVLFGNLFGRVKWFKKFYRVKYLGLSE